MSIINDESGAYNPAMADVVKEYKAGWIFMHTGGKSSKETTEYENGVVAVVVDFFNDIKTKAVAFGINEDSLSFDCGIGFGKTRNDDIELLKNCKALSQYSPLLIGESR